MPFTDQVKAQEKKKIDLVEKRRKEKDEKELFDKAIEDPHTLTEDQWRDVTTASD